MKYKYPHTAAEVAANEWEEITEETATWLLECLPPAARSGPAFAVGETLDHMDDGRPVHTVVVKVDGKFYSKPWPLGEFNAAVLVHLVRRQLAKV